MATAAAATGAAALPGGSASASTGRRVVVDPTPPGVFYPQPFLRLPFARHDAQRSLYVTNGWLMSADEMPYEGDGAHGAVDFVLARHTDNGYGRPIYAGAPGRAYRSYQAGTTPWADPNTGVTHQLGFGGLFVEVRYQPNTAQQRGFVVQYFHFSAVNTDLAYLPPVQDGNDWFPAGVVQSTDEDLWALGTPVDATTIIGWLGDTGNGFDYLDAFDVATGTVEPRDRTALPGWDPPHVHVGSTYQGRDASHHKVNILDPMGIWGQVRPGEWTGNQADVECNPYTPEPGRPQVGPRSLYLTDQHGRPLYADE